MTENPDNLSGADRAIARPWLPTVLLVLVAVVATGGWLDRSAAGYYESAFQRALVTFALARAMNGVISVIQGTEVAVEPAGVGVTFTPGEIVDPINDLIERFSWLMLASTTSLGIQKILMDISAWGGIRVLTVLSLVVVGFVLWRNPKSIRKRRWAIRLALLDCFLRFAMPLMVVINDGIYQLFMAEGYEQSSAVVEQTNRELEAMAEEEQPAGDEGWMNSVRRWFGERADALNVNQRMAHYRDRLTNATEHLLRLAAVFVLQTIILPLLFLWALAKAVGNLGRFR
ncbi:MAG: hypothetical protein R3200_15870 [Xanthomonadales bacterium]|nr:hypothetical protein [Xanthomonadales bacterium]